MILETIKWWVIGIGEWLGPIILAVLGIYYSVKEIQACFANRKAKRTSNLTVDLLNKIVSTDKTEALNDIKSSANKVFSAVEKAEKILKTESSIIRSQSSTLGEMLGLIFENSSLDPAVKERLRVLKTKLDCPSESEMLEELISQNTLLKDQLTHTIKEIEEIKEQDTVKIVKDVAADTTPKKTVSHTIIQ